MNARRSSQILQVSGIGGEQLVAVAGEAHEGGVDGVRPPASSEQYPRALAKAIVQRLDVNPDKKPRDLDLAPGSPSPDLGDDAAVGQR